jgi:hypothetical protein
VGRRARGGNGFYALYFGEAASQLQVIIFRLERQTSHVGRASPRRQAMP